MSISFSVSPVARATAPLPMPASGAVIRLHKWRVEAMGATTPRFLPAHENGLLAAVHAAYADHYPLVLSPDTIWLAIAQGFAQHVNANADRLRGRFVRHEGRATIEIRRDDFIKGSPDNRWPEVFSAFSDAIAGHIGRQRDLVVCDFSTTGPCERAASEIVLLDAVQRYFDYVMLTLCGIPEITLEGTAEDWRSIQRRARAFEEYELSWWTDALSPVLDELLATAEGRVDQHFWQSVFPMHFLGGFVGVTQDADTLAVRPVIGWAVRDAVEESGGQSPEERAADWLMAQQTDSAGNATLIAGWLSGGELTAVEINALAANVVRLGGAARVRLTCVLLDRVADAQDLLHARLSIRFVVGVRVAASSPGRQLSFNVDHLRREVLAAHNLPAELRRDLAELVPGGLGGEPALYLRGGALRFSSRRNDRSFLVAEGSEAATIDVSPEAHAARVSTARELGFEESSIPYLLCDQRSP